MSPRQVSYEYYEQEKRICLGMFYFPISFTLLITLEVYRVHF